MELSQSTLQDLVLWYRAEHRPFPWRRVRLSNGMPNPYFVWISEVMSQQSTMGTVLPFFERWMNLFPNLENLAAAREEEVLKAWAGLGYYSRARNVLKAARMLDLYRKDHAGEWPQSLDEWERLPGVGPYTSAAVTSISFENAAIPVDGNVLRVMSRFLDIADPLNLPSDRQSLEESLRSWAPQIPRGSRGDLSQALMELGARVCRPGAQAQCQSCPLQADCATGSRPDAASRVVLRPLAKRRPSALSLVCLAPIYAGPRDQVLLRQIPKGQRLEGQWELPWMELPQRSAKVETVLKSFQKQGWSVLKAVRHSITRYRYEVYGVQIGRWTGKIPQGHRLWHPNEELHVTTLTRKVLENAFSS